MNILSRQVIEILKSAFNPVSNWFQEWMNFYLGGLLRLQWLGAPNWHFYSEDVSNSAFRVPIHWVHLLCQPLPPPSQPQQGNVNEPSHHKGNLCKAKGSENLFPFCSVSWLHSGSNLPARAFLGKMDWASIFQCKHSWVCECPKNIWVWRCLNSWNNGHLRNEEEIFVSV